MLDTIAAIATPPLPSAIAIIRVSGPETQEKIDAEISWLKGRYSSRSSSREWQFIQPINRESLTIQVMDYLKIENGEVLFIKFWTENILHQELLKFIVLDIHHSQVMSIP